MTGKDQNGNSIRLPWQLAWALAGLLFLAGGSWARQEVGTKALGDAIKAQGLRIEYLEARARATAVTQDDLAAVHDSLARELRRTRSVFNARADDLEFRLSQLAAELRNSPVRRYPR